MKKNNLLTIVLLLVIIFLLPLAVYLTRQKTDIRPKALEGMLNFNLSASSQNVAAGDTFDVSITGTLTSDKLRVSGVDIILLYDSARLEVTDVVPATQNGPFTDKIIAAAGGTFSNSYDFLRLSEVARKSSSQLPGGTFQIGTVKFRAKATGAANIIFPEDNKYLQVVGVEL